MDIEAYRQREKLLELREALIAVEEERLSGHTGSTPDELEAYLNQIIGARG
jgi:hypothetical protein